MAACETQNTGAKEAVDVRPSHDTIIEESSTFQNSKLETITRVSSVPSSEGFPPVLTSEAHIWSPSYFRCRPVIGLGAVGLAIACLFASLAVLLASNGQPVTAWLIQPTVYLAIATAVSNTALSCALAEAAPILWWYKAIRGSNVSRLELEWQAGQGFPRALVKSFQYGQRISMLTVASIAVALVVIDGPLLQRSSSVRPATLRSDVTLDIALSPEIPHGFSGDYYAFTEAWTLSMALEIVGSGYIHQTPIISTANCNHTCTAKVHGPGVAIGNCTSKRWPIDRKSLTDPNVTWGSGGAFGYKPVFFSSFDRFTSLQPSKSLAEGESPLLAIGRARYSRCVGEYVETNCTLQSVIREYEIELDGHAIAFTAPLDSAPIIAVANNTGVVRQLAEGAPTALTMDGLVLYLHPFVFANATLMGSGRNGSTEAIVYDTINLFVDEYATTMSGCEMQIKDPTSDIIGQLNELFFRAGLFAGTWPNIRHLLDPGLSAEQAVPSVQTWKVNTFHSDLRWFAGAAVLQILTIMLVLPAFWGWWKIGTDMTLSPFHLAKLFNAPILEDIRSTAGPNEIVRSIGNVRVRLGLLKEDVLAAPTGDRREEHMQAPNMRIGIAEASGVDLPHRGLLIDR